MKKNNVLKEPEIIIVTSASLIFLSIGIILFSLVSLFAKLSMLESSIACFLAVTCFIGALTAFQILIEKV